MRKFDDPAVAAVFRAYPKALRAKLMRLRKLVFDVAARTPGVGPLQETLKWGQPSFVTAQSKSGSTIRIDQSKTGNSRYGMYFHCQTTLIDTFRSMYPDDFAFEGDRLLVFGEHDRIPVDELSHCISLALTYRLRKK